LDDARRLELQRPRLARLDRAAAVERVPERIDHTTQERVADGHARNTTGPASRLALLHVLPLAEERDADVVLLKVERDADDAVLELEHLRRDRVLEAVDACDAVADLKDGPNLAQVGLDVVLLDPRLQDLGDLFGPELHGSPFDGVVVFCLRGLSSPPRTLASTRIGPACSTMPPISSGSTLRDASTGRPDAFSICCTISRASSSVSSFAVVSSTVSRRSSAAASRSNPWRSRRSRPAGFFSIVTRRK